MLTFTVNLKEYYKTLADESPNKKHKEIKKAAPGFQIYANRIFLSTIVIILKSPLQIQKKSRLTAEMVRCNRKRPKNKIFVI